MILLNQIREKSFRKRHIKISKKKSDDKIQNVNHQNFRKKGI